MADLLSQADEIRAAAASVGAGLEAIPGELAAIDVAERAARTSEHSERLELADAENRLAELQRSRRKSKEAIAEAERDVLRAREAVAESVARIDRALARRRALLEHEAVLRAEAEGLTVAARETAAAILEVPSVSSSGRSRPGAGLAEIEEWGGRAHAALFVVRGGLEAERERIVVEANVLAAAVLREPLGGIERRARAAAARAVLAGD